MSKSDEFSQKFQELYPERDGKKEEIKKLDFLTGQSNRVTIIRNCENQVIKCFEQFSLLKLMWSALNSNGCKLDLTRNFSCEYCQPGTSDAHIGNFDSDKNQIIVCANNLSSSCCGFLLRETISMFDKCTKKSENLTKTQNLEHLACTEIRKANLASCNFSVNLTRKDANFVIDNQHQNCVRSVAIESLQKTRFLSQDQSTQLVDKTFDKCYKDLEPIGRRAINKLDMMRAYHERYLFGY